jgi:AcrR family transcriptional regulator
MGVAAPTRTPPERWIEAGLRALAAGGPEAVRVEVLAQDLGVTKGGFYWQFDGRPALLAAMLERWERAVVTEVIERLDRERGDARRKVGRLFALAATIPDLMQVELAIRDWARRDADVARRLRRVDNRRMAYMRSLFQQFCPDEDEVEARCLIALSLFVSAPLIAAEHQGRRRSEVVEHVLKRLQR